MYQLVFKFNYNIDSTIKLDISTLLKFCLSQIFFIEQHILRKYVWVCLEQPFITFLADWFMDHSENIFILSNSYTI